MHDAREYTYRVFWSSEDEEYVARCVEFPGLSNLDSSQEEALGGMVNVVRDALALLADEGRPAPEPLGGRTYSGHLSLRLPPEEHRRIALEAAEAGVSINQLICSRI